MLIEKYGRNDSYMQGLDLTKSVDRIKSVRLPV